MAEAGPTSGMMLIVARTAGGEDPAWNANDAWVLAAITMDRSREPHQLTELIATADAIKPRHPD